MAKMTEKELCDIYQDATGEDGFIATVKGLARFFNEGEYRNETMVTYTHVQRAFELIATTPSRFRFTEAPEKFTTVPQSIYTGAQVEKFLDPLTELVLALRDWIDDEEPCEYDAITEQIEPVISLIKGTFCDGPDESVRELCRNTFFNKAYLPKFYVYIGSLFTFIATHAPSYNDLDDPFKLTERSRKAAEEKYNHALDPMRTFIVENENPVDKLDKEIIKRLKDIDNGYVSARDVRFNSSFLTHIPLALSLRPYIDFYEYYGEDEEVDYIETAAYNGVPAHTAVSSEMPERKFQANLLEHFKQYILGGALLTQKLGSSAYSTWSDAFIALTQNKFDRCIELLRDAISRTFADNVINRYKRGHTIVEEPPAKMRRTGDDYNRLLMLAKQYVEATRCFHKAILVNKTELYFGDKTAANIERSALLVQPHVQPVIGAYQGGFIEMLEAASDILRDNRTGKLSLSRTLEELHPLWNNFFRRLKTMITEDQQRAAIVQSQSAFSSLFSLYQYKLYGAKSWEVSAQEIDDRCNEFIKTLPSLAMCIDSLGKRTYGDTESQQTKPTAVVIAGYTEQGRSDLIESVRKGNRKPRSSPVNRSDGGLTQEQVADDFGVSRQCVIGWEKAEEKDGKLHNKYGYYKKFRLDPDFQGAYSLLVKCVKQYKKDRKAAKITGKRFGTFVRYKENWIKHNIPKT